MKTNLIWDQLPLQEMDNSCGRDIVDTASGNCTLKMILGKLISGRTKICRTGRGANLETGFGNLFFWTIFPKNCTKLKKKLDQERGTHS